MYRFRNEFFKNRSGYNAIFFKREEKCCYRTVQLCYSATHFNHVAHSAKHPVSTGLCCLPSFLITRSPLYCLLKDQPSSKILIFMWTHLVTQTQESYYQYLGLQQHVYDATHIHGNILDLFVSQQSESAISGIPRFHRLLSDHFVNA